MKKVLLMLIIVLSAICGCTKEKNNYVEGCVRADPESEECDQAYVNCVAYNYMKDWYLWYEYLPEIDVNEYETLSSMVDALKYHDGDTLIDRFSYSVKTSDHDDYYAGKRYGMGTSWRRDDDNRLFVYLVYPGSPAGVAGLKRGQEILEINGYTVAELDENKIYNQEHKNDADFVEKTDWNNVYNSENEGEAVNIKLLENDTDVVETTVYLGDYTMKSVLGTSVVDNDGVLTGYINFKAFINSSADELDEAFASFKEQGIKELIVDLRYNGGGLVSGAHHMINLIAGSAVEGKDVIKIVYNDKHQDADSTYEGEKLENSIDMKKVAFIATSGTASASEMVINSLAPFIDVSIIGDTTYGKPVGMNALNICDQTIVPITFKNSNAEDFGDYYYGLSVTCSADDDFKHDFGDAEESSMKEALYYLKNGQCSGTVLKHKNIENREPLSHIPFELKGMNRIDYTF